MHEAMAASNSRARVDIWLSFGAAVRETPLAGSGFGSSARLHEAPLAARVPPERRELLGAGHPHNAALQVWVELGLLGAGLALAVALLALRSPARRGARALAPRLALFGGAAAVALVGHGAWQGWWAAALGASIVWFRIVSFREPAR
jgi:O-antigen ligase